MEIPLGLLGSPPMLVLWSGLGPLRGSHSAESIDPPLTFFSALKSEESGYYIAKFFPIESLKGRQFPFCLVRNSRNIGMHDASGMPDRLDRSINHKVAPWILFICK